MNSSRRSARLLLVAAVVGVLVPATWYGRLAVEDSGAFAVVLFGVPLGCAVLALWVERATATRLGPAVVAVLGLVALGWALVTGLGIGLVFVPTALLLLSAAAVSGVERTARHDPGAART